MENPEHKTLVSKIIELFQMIFRKLSKLFDKVVFNKKGSLFISLFLASFQFLLIMKISLYLYFMIRQFPLRSMMFQLKH